MHPVRHKLCSTLIAGILAGCGVAERYETGISSGYGTGKRDFIPINLYAGAEANKAIGLDKDYGTLHLGIQTTHHIYTHPDQGQYNAISPYFRYSYPNANLQAYVEGGAGPGYLNMGTREQGNSGFNFIDQAGGGIRYTNERFSFNLGYRYSHISHAGTRDAPNRGLDGHSVIFGLSFNY